MSSQVVDTLTAKELMEEALKKISQDELSTILYDLEVKGNTFRSLLGKEAIEYLDETRLRELMMSVFSMRRKVNTILEKYPAATIKSEISGLLYGDGSLEHRFDSFCASSQALDQRIQYDFASELLHFTHPDTFWLWTKWMWDPKTKTGSLPLVIMTDFNLQRPTLGQMYLRVGEAVVFVTNVGEAAGFQKMGSGLFGTDVYLAMVYGIYIYTVLKMRMTQEFNKVIPELPEMIRRLLGVYRFEVKQHAKGESPSGGEQEWV